MKHSEIKKALEEKGLTFSALAEASGRQPQNLSSCPARKTRSKPAALVISAALELSVTEVFPDIKEYAEVSTEVKHKQRVERAKKLMEAAGLTELIA